MLINKKLKLIGSHMLLAGCAALLVATIPSYGQQIMPVAANQVVVLASPSLPVKVMNGSYQVTDQHAIVDITLSPAFDTNIKSVHVLLLHLRGNRVLGGQGFTVPVGNPSRQSQQQFTPFFIMDPGDNIGSFVTGVNEYNGETVITAKGYKALSNQILEILQGSKAGAVFPMKDMGQGNLAPVALSPIYGSHRIIWADSDEGQIMMADHESCADVQQSAVEDCAGNGGIHSFSCNPDTGSYSFTCGI